MSHAWVGFAYSHAIRLSMTGQGSHKHPMAVHRLFALLQCLPRTPDALSPQQLAQRIAERFEIEAYLPIEVSAETARKRLQRDLSHLEQLLGSDVLHCERSMRQRPLYSLDADLVLPGQDPDLTVIWQTLSQLGALAIPPLVAKDAARRTRQTVRHLTEAQRNWSAKVRLHSRMWLPAPPLIDPGTLQVVQQALFEDRQLLLTYTSRGVKIPKLYSHVHPLLLLIRDGVVYLVARHRATIKQFALHRMSLAEVLLDGCDRADFDPDLWLTTCGDPYQELQAIRWVFRVSSDLAEHLREQPVGVDDRWSKPDSAGYSILTTDMRYSERLIWWILGLGGNIEVKEPVEVRLDIRQRLERALSPYEQD